MSLSLSRRLQSLYEQYKVTLNLIAQLQSFPPTSPDADRLDLASQIHDSLKEQEDTLALLREELDSDDTYPSSRRRSTSKDTESSRSADLVARLTEDLKSARAKFRRAQLQAKKNADDAKRKEREALFKRKDGEDPPSRSNSRLGQRGQDKLTQDELARNATEDVTRALRRAHDLLSANLSQSQFAQQTLDESQDALRGLGESYGGMDDLLKSSKGLVRQLVSSNKSDSWYLQTAFYLMAITLVWLVFRRLFYGPLWWLVFMPLKIGWKSTGLLLGGGPLVPASAVASSSATRNRGGVPTNPSGVVFKSMELPAKGGGWGGRARPGESPEQAEESMVEKVGKMIDDAQERRIDIDNLSEEEQRIQAQQPRNTKKRMMDVDVDGDRKDEL
jgi:hypothetical protein